MAFCRYNIRSYLDLIYVCSCIMALLFRVILLFWLSVLFFDMIKSKLYYSTMLVYDFGSPFATLFYILY